MSISTKKWLVAKPLSANLLSQYRQISPVLAQVLHNRRFSNPQDAKKFLYVRKTNNPLQRGIEMKDVRKAAIRLLEAIEKRQKIVVYGDFDADGVTATVLMVEALESLGAIVEPYIPDRIDEGYGLNTDALEILQNQDVNVVITVDCGIRAIQEVEDGKKLGLDIIITDHHSVGQEIPDAYAVVNPKQNGCPYPEKMLAGVGIAYKVASTLFQLHYQSKLYQSTKIRDGVTQKLENLLDLVAIGTVADLAPLNHPENRVLVQRGLKKLNEAQRPGVRALLKVASIEPGKVTAMSIGFGLGPRINAAGRLDSAMNAYDLLAAHDEDEAARLAEKLHDLNEERRSLTIEAQNMVRQQLKENDYTSAPLIFAQSTQFKPGIVGLVAGRLTEEFYRPAVVMEEGETESRASCRSIPQFDITTALDKCADWLVRHGGHAQAAGFTVLNDNIPKLKEHLTELARKQLDGQDLRPVLDIDAEVSVFKSDEELLELYMELSLLEPTGHENPVPIFIVRNVYIPECRTVGKEGRHLKLKVQRPGRPSLDAIAFGLGEWAKHLPAHVDLAYQLELNEWNGRKTLQLNVLDIRLAGSVNGAG